MDKGQAVGMSGCRDVGARIRDVMDGERLGARGSGQEGVRLPPSLAPLASCREAHKL